MVDARARYSHSYLTATALYSMSVDSQCVIDFPQTIGPDRDKLEILKLVTSASAQERFLYPSPCGTNAIRDVHDA